ncbi:MAG: hypothetical protein LWW95_04435 [Candidatus Desulfofervidus auxilii]|nr:hypothetical protein [Candidatus Desulfofervidus auxilii]
MLEVDAKGFDYKDLNRLIRKKVAEGERHFILRHVNGQRYVGAGIEEKIKIEIYGTPGQDLGTFMQGPEIVVYGNAQDGVGNTMDDGKIIVHGLAGDIVGYAMRGGRIHILGDVGYRAGIHMKGFDKKNPVIIIGGCAGGFLGEYMAGGIIIVLGFNKKGSIAGMCLGTGMHGGVIYVRGKVDTFYLGEGAVLKDIEEKDYKLLRKLLKEYCEDFSFELEKIFDHPFQKIVPASSRPYGQLYTT